MTFKIEYASRRAEVWRWYWKSWRRGFWKTHLAAFLSLPAIALLLGGGFVHPTASILGAFGLGVIAIGIMIAYPQVMFKPKARVLLVDPGGVETTVGAVSGKRAWSDMRAVVEEDECVVLTAKNGNAFIVPMRAFASSEMRADFLSFVRNSISE